MGVEVATLKPLFSRGNEVDQVWRVCEIIGSPRNWYNKTGGRVGGGEWRERKLSFLFPPDGAALDGHHPPGAPVASRAEPLCHLVPMWDTMNRPTPSQARAHEYFADAGDPLWPKSSASRILGWKQSDISSRSSRDVSMGNTSTKPSWSRESLIGHYDGGAEPSVVPAAAPKVEIPAPRPAPAIPSVASDVAVSKRRTSAKRAT